MRSGCRRVLGRRFSSSPPPFLILDKHFLIATQHQIALSPIHGTRPRFHAAAPSISCRPSSRMHDSDPSPRRPLAPSHWPEADEMYVSMDTFSPLQKYSPLRRAVLRVHILHLYGRSSTICICEAFDCICSCGRVPRSCALNAGTSVLFPQTDPHASLGEL
jgi:hypothetical protein